MEHAKKMNKNCKTNEKKIVQTNSSPTFEYDIIIIFYNFGIFNRRILLIGGILNAFQNVWTISETETLDW